MTRPLFLTGQDSCRDECNIPKLTSVKKNPPDKSEQVLRAYLVAVANKLQDSMMQKRVQENVTLVKAKKREEKRD